MSQCPYPAFFPLNGHSGLFTVPIPSIFSTRWALSTLHSARPRLFFCSMGTLDSSQCQSPAFFPLYGHSILFCDRDDSFSRSMGTIILFLRDGPFPTARHHYRYFKDPILFIRSKNPIADIGGLGAAFFNSLF